MCIGFIPFHIHWVRLQKCYKTVFKSSKPDKYWSFSYILHFLIMSFYLIPLTCWYQYHIQGMLAVYLFYSNNSPFWHLFSVYQRKAKYTYSNFCLCCNIVHPRNSIRCTKNNGLQIATPPGAYVMRTVMEDQKGDCIFLYVTKNTAWESTKTPDCSRAPHGNCMLS